MDAVPILITLDRPRRVRWTNRAEARNSSLPRPASFTQLARGRNRLYALCAILWSALVDRDHPFEEPEDLAEHLGTAEQQLAAIEAVRAMLEEAYPEQKKSEAGVTSPGASGSGSTSGPGPSSSAAPPAPTGGASFPASLPPSSAPASRKSAGRHATKPTS